jgi:hypothetical protein
LSQSYFLVDQDVLTDEILSETKNKDPRPVGDFYVLSINAESFTPKSLVGFKRFSKDAIESAIESIESGNSVETLKSQNVNVNNFELDADGRPIQRLATAAKGWHYQPHWIEISTSTINGFFNKNYDDTDLGFVSLKLYDASDVEITLQTDADTNCVKTVIDWEPTHDYEIVASKIFSGSPTEDLRVWVIGAPDIPEYMGGSKVFGQGGINLKLIGDIGAADTDGRSSKFMIYTAGVGTNKFRIVCRHSAGYKHTFGVLWEIYKA